MEDDVIEGEKDGETEQANLILTTCYKLALHTEPRLSTGCDVLTDFFRGGFVTRKLYEIFGESGSGKTQLAI